MKSVENPNTLVSSLSDFHQYMQERATQWPSSLSSTSTHDTKRSEDVRARINVLSEIPTEWRQHLRIVESAEQKGEAHQLTTNWLQV